jgi:ankyrin repeat protein
VRCVRALLTAGAVDANQLSADLSRQRIETPLLAAARQDRTDLAAALLEYGADVNTVDW